MIRGTTPTIRFTFNIIDPAQVTAAYLTILQGNKDVVEKDLSAATVGESFIEWTLSQENTLALSKCPTCQIQARYKTVDGKAYASRIYTVNVADILKDGEI